MKKTKRIILTVIIVVIDLASVFLVSLLFSEYRLKFVDTYVSNVTITSRNRIEESYLTKIKVPKEYINEDTYVSKEDIIGKYVSLNATIPKGSLFYKDALDDTSNMNDLMLIELASDETSYDLFVKDIKVNPGHLLKGMNVDLYVTVNRKEINSDLLISNARIIGLYDHSNNEIKDDKDHSNVNSITLAVKKDMVPYINKAITIGEVNLLVSSDLYKNKSMYLNTDSKVYELLK